MYRLLCVFLVWPTKFENTLSFMQNIFNAWEFKRMDWKSHCLENWVQNLCFWKTFDLILMHFIHQIQCFEEFLHKIALIFQKFVFFQNFDRSNLFFNQSKLRLKTLVSPYLFQSMLDWYWINRSIFDQSNLIFDQSKII